MAVVGEPHTRGRVPDAAVLAQTMRSLHSAKSVPPPTQKPWTWAITGLGERQRAMYVSATNPCIRRRSAMGSPGPAGSPLLHDLRAPADVVAGAERAARAAQPDHPDRGVGVGLRERGADVLRELGGDRVEPLRPVQREVGRPRLVVPRAPCRPWGGSLDWRSTWRAPSKPAPAALLPLLVDGARGPGALRGHPPDRPRHRGARPRSSTSCRRRSCSASTACTTSRTWGSPTAASSRSRTAGSA